jgi:hypothetical protein
MAEARGRKCYIENEGITRDVIQNKRRKYFRNGITRDVDEK